MRHLDHERLAHAAVFRLNMGKAIDTLNKVLGLGYSDVGWCLAIENDRGPHTTPPTLGAAGRFRDVPQVAPQNTQCRCGSTTHKRTNHSSCPLNPKKTQRGRA